MPNWNILIVALGGTIVACILSGALIMYWGMRLSEEIAIHRATLQTDTRNRRGYDSEMMHHFGNLAKGLADGDRNRIDRAMSAINLKIQSETKSLEAHLRAETRVRPSARQI